MMERTTAGLAKRPVTPGARQVAGSLAHAALLACALTAGGGVVSHARAAEPQAKSTAEELRDLPAEIVTAFDCRNLLRSAHALNSVRKPEQLPPEFAKVQMQDSVAWTQHGTQLAEKAGLSEADKGRVYNLKAKTLFSDKDINAAMPRIRNCIQKLPKS